MTRAVALLGVVGISFSAIFVGLADVAATSATFYRTALAAPVLLALAAARGLLPVAGGPAWSPAGVRFALATGAIFALNVTVWHVNIAVAGAGLSTLMGNLQVVLVGVIAWWLHGERPTGLTLALLPVLLLAVAMIAGVVGEPTTIRRPWLAAGLGLATAAANATYLLSFRQASRRLPSSLAALVLVTFAAAATTLALSPADPAFALRVPAGALAWLAALALVSQVLGWLAITPALRRLPTLEVGMLLLLQPMLTILWGAWIFGERHTGVQWAGVAILVAGLALVQIRGVTRPAPAAAAPATVPGAGGGAAPPTPTPAPAERQE